MYLQLLSTSCTLKCYSAMLGTSWAFNLPSSFKYLCLWKQHQVHNHRKYCIERNPWQSYSTTLCSCRSVQYWAVSLRASSRLSLSSDSLVPVTIPPRTLLQRPATALVENLFLTMYSLLQLHFTSWSFTAGHQRDQQCPSALEGDVVNISPCVGPYTKLCSQ